MRPDFSMYSTLDITLGLLALIVVLWAWFVCIGFIFIQLGKNLDRLKEMDREPDQKVTALQKDE